MSAAAKRVAAITGGSSGIGRAIAERFHQAGYAVSVCARGGRPAWIPKSFHYCRADVRIQSHQNRFVKETVRRWGGLSVFVNCAGVSRWRRLESVTPAFARDLLETNVMGTLWGCAAAARVLAHGGAIINVSSLAGKRGSANNSVYCASKFAVNGITQALAKELGPRGIRVNAVCPVYVKTERILASLAEPDSPARGQSVERYLSSFTAEQTALGRLPTAGEVASAALFLASPQASAITGQCLNVDGGVFPQ